MPTLTTTSIYPKPRKRKAVLVPPKRLKVPAIGTFERAANVNLNRFEREKSHLFEIINRDLDALYAANATADDYSISDIEKAHDTFVASGLMYRIIMAKRG